MKKAFSFLVIITLTVSAFSQTWARLEEAHKYVGNTVNLVGFVSDVRYVKNAEDYTTLIALDGKDHTHTLTLIIHSFERPDLTALKTAYLDEYIHVKGKVEMYKGKAQMIISSKKQISIARQAPEKYNYEPL